MKESFIIMRNEPTKIHHKQPNKSKKYVLELRKKLRILFRYWVYNYWWSYKDEYWSINKG